MHRLYMLFLQEFTTGKHRISPAMKTINRNLEIVFMTWRLINITNVCNSQSLVPKIQADQVIDPLIVDCRLLIVD